MLDLIRRHGVQIFTFGCVGITATLTHYVTALIVVERLHFGVQIGNFFGFWAAFLVSYLGQSLLTFKSRPNLRNLIQYLVLAGSNFFASALILEFLIGVFEWNHRIALFIVVATLPFISFFVSKKVIFKQN